MSSAESLPRTPGQELDTTIRREVVRYEPSARISGGQEVIVPHREENTNPAHGGELVPVSDERITVVVSGVTEGSESQSARQSAHREFDKSMADSQSKGRLRSIVSGVVRGNFLREGIMARNRNKAHKRIAETGRLDDMTSAQWQDVSAESIQRVLDDAGTMEYMHQAAGERRDQLDGEQGQPIKELMNQLLTEYVGGQLDRDNLEEASRRRLAELAASNEGVSELIGAGNVYMSNIGDIAEMVKAQVDHQRGLQSVLDRIDYVSARVKTNANTEARASNIEKFLEKSPINSATASIGLAAAYGLGVAFGKSTLNKLTRFGVVSIGSGVTAYFQEKSRLAFERGQVARETEMGEAVDGTERRDRLADTMYDMKQASVLTEALRARRNQEEKYEVGSEADFTALAAAVAEMSARHDLSGVDLRKVDGFEGRREQIVSFISHSSAERKPAEVRAMMAERFAARAALRQYYEGQAQSDSAFMGGVDFDAYMQRATSDVGETLIANAMQQDEKYDALSRKEAWKSAARGVVLGTVLAGAVQEATSFANQHVEGLTEYLRQMNPRAETSTILAHAAHLLKNGEADNSSGLEDITKHSIGNNTLTVDGSVSGAMLSGDHLDVTLADGEHVSVAVDSDGAPTRQGIATLNKHGLAVTDKKVPHTTTSQVQREVTPKQFAKNYGGKSVNRGWVDNNTQKFDKNELKLDLEVDANGNYVYDVSRMLKGGSFHDGKEASLNYGKMKILLSPTEGTQATPIQVSLNEHGQAIIGKDSPLAQMFSMKDGQPQFTGKFAEAAQMDGTRADGSQNVTMLATDVGAGHTEPFIDTVKVKVDTIHHDIKIVRSDMTNFIPTVDTAPSGVEMPPVITVPARGGLRREGPSQSGEVVPNIPPAGGGSGSGPEGSNSQPGSGRETSVYSRTFGTVNRATRREQGADADRTTQGANERPALKLIKGGRAEQDQRRRQQDKRQQERMQTRDSVREQNEGLVDENGLTPTQWAQDHPDYRKAVDAYNGETDSAKRRQATKDATRVYRKLQSYYERRLRRERGVNPHDATPLAADASVYQRVAVDSRYLEELDKVDLARDNEERLRHDAETAPSGAGGLAQRAAYYRAEQHRKAAERSLLVLKSQLLAAYDTADRSQEQALAA